MRIVEPDYIIDAWEQIDSYMEKNGLESRLRDDAPEYIKDAYVALIRRSKWIKDEYEL